MTIYVEGGGNSAKERSECQKGFAKFFEAAGMKARMPKIVACGPRNDAFDRFKTALRGGVNALLLVDSEAPVRQDPITGKSVNPWDHLQERDDWERPSGATDTQVHLMVECMEAWFLADRDQFIAYYSTGNRRCNPKAIPIVDDVELISKDRIYSYLDAASSASGVNVKYGKGNRSFDVLSITRPEKVARASYHARRLFYHLHINPSWLDLKEFE